MKVDTLQSLIKSLHIKNEKGISSLRIFDVLASLEEERYEILENKTKKELFSKVPLKPQQKYWGNLEFLNQKLLLASKPIVFPKIGMYNKKSAFTLYEIQTLFKQKETPIFLKEMILQKVQDPLITKEDFIGYMNLLLSLENNVLTLPLLYEKKFSILQLKKRYNKKTQTKQIDFYTALEFLGPIAGIITFDKYIKVEIKVAFESTAFVLLQNKNTLAYDVDIEVISDIKPLYEMKTNLLLDINI